MLDYTCLYNLVFIFCLGTWFQLKKDKFKLIKERLTNFLSDIFGCLITSWLKLTYKGMMRLKKVTWTYLDLTTDFILVGTVMAALSTNDDNMFASEFLIFA